MGARAEAGRREEPELQREDSVLLVPLQEREGGGHARGEGYKYWNPGGSVTAGCGWGTQIIPIDSQHGRPSQEDWEVKASLGYTEAPTSVKF